MNVALFGSTGAVGRRVLERVLDDGHRVSALVRERSRPAAAHARLRVVRGDVLDPPAVEATVEGAQAAIVTLGARRVDDESVVSRGVAHIVPALERAGGRRLSFLSILGVGDTLAHTGLARFVLPRVMGEALRDRAVAEDIIRGSELDWIIVRATRLVGGGGSGSPRIGEDVRVGLFSTSRRGDIARFLVESLTDDRFVGRAPTLAS